MAAGHSDVFTAEEAGLGIADRAAAGVADARHASGFFVEDRG